MRAADQGFCSARGPRGGGAHQLLDLGEAIANVVDDQHSPERTIRREPLAGLHPHELGLLHNPPAAPLRDVSKNSYYERMQARNIKG